MQQEPEKLYDTFLNVYKADFNEETGSKYAICTNICKWLIDNHFPNAKIVGYYCDENPTAIVGEAEGGHDFLLIDDTYIIDFWYKTFYDQSTPAIIKASDQTVYGDKSTWTEVYLIN